MDALLFALALGGTGYLVLIVGIKLADRLDRINQALEVMPDDEHDSYWTDHDQQRPL